MQFSSDRLPIFLHENAIAILEKYKDEEFRGGKALPYMTSQQMNRCLKDLCEICGFNTPYTITYYKNNIRHNEVKPKYAFTECYVNEQLARIQIPTFYHSSNESECEIDFAVQTKKRVIPIEAKAEENVKGKSLKVGWRIFRSTQLKGIFVQRVFRWNNSSSYHRSL